MAEKEASAKKVSSPSVVPQPKKTKVPHQVGGLFGCLVVCITVLFQTETQSQDGVKKRKRSKGAKDSKTSTKGSFTRDATGTVVPAPEPMGLGEAAGQVSGFLFVLTRL